MITEDHLTYVDDKNARKAGGRANRRRPGLARRRAPEEAPRGALAVALHAISLLTNDA